MPIDLSSYAIDLGTPNQNDGTPGRTCFDRINQMRQVIEDAVNDAELKAFVVSVTDQEQTLEERQSGLSGSALRTFRMPYQLILTEVRASCSLEDSGGNYDFDIQNSGTTIFDSGDMLTIPSGTRTSVGASPQPDVAGVVLGDDDEITIASLSAPSGGVATGFNVTFIGYVFTGSV